MRKFYTLITFMAAGLFSAGHAQCTDPVLTSATGPDAVCNGSTANLTAVTDGGQVAWFTAETGGTELGTGTSFETDELTESTSFWAEAQNIEIGDPVSGGAKVAPTGSSGSTVLPASDPWGLSFNATEAFVLNSVDVFLTSGTAGNIVIELKDEEYNVLETLTVAAPAGGSNSNPVQFTVPLGFVIQPGIHRLLAVSGPAMIRDLASGGFPFPIGSFGNVTGGTINNSATSNTSTYYFFYNWNFSEYNACVSDRMEVVVDVNTIEPPVVDSFSSCEAGTVADLTGEGEMLQWYQESEGGEALLDEEVLETGTYYATQTVDGCESSRVAVEVTITDTPEPSNEDLFFCNNVTINDIEIEGENINWYISPLDIEPLDGSTELNTGSYYISQSIDDCESERVEIAVTIDITPAPDVFEQFFCDSATIGDLEADGENIQWFSDEEGLNLLEDETEITSGTYYVTQTTGECESSPIPVPIIVSTTPDAPIADPVQTFTEGETLADLEVEGEELYWYSDEEGQEQIPNTTALIDGYTYYVSQLFLACESDLTAITVTNTLSSTNEAFSNFKYYPNPVENVLYLSNSQSIGKVEIYNLQGQRIYASEFGSTAIEVDFSSFAAGTYIAKVESAGGIKNIKITRK